MDRANAWIPSMLILVGGNAGCGDCAREGCAATDRPAGGASIGEGIAGAASDESDMCVEDCCECPLVTATLTVLPTDGPVADAKAAEALLMSDAEREEVAIERRYEHELAPGDYLGCIVSHGSGTWSACAPFGVEPGRVTTVHARLLFGPGSVGVYTPDGDEAGPSYAVFSSRK